jgi:DNA polymerase-4
VLTREQACARFAESPPSLIPGIGPKTADRLAALGLRSLRAVACAQPELLAQRFGANHGPDIQRRARFEHSGRVGQARKVASESRERTFDRDISDRAELRDALSRMAQQLCEGLKAHGRSGRTIGIKVRLDDFTTVTRARTLREPTADTRVVREVALELLERYAPPRPVRLLGVRVAGLGTRAGRPDGGERASQADAEQPAGAGQDGAHGRPQLALPV